MLLCVPWLGNTRTRQRRRLPRCRRRQRSAQKTGGARRKPGRRPLSYLLRGLAEGPDPRLQRHIHLDGLAADVIDDRNGRRLGDLVDLDRSGLELLRSEVVAGDVDHVVDPTEDPEVAVLGLDRAIAAQERPVTPILAV